jgi:hypothetical protein
MIIRKVSIAAVASVSVLAPAAAASAGQYGWTTIEHPAIACSTVGSTGIAVNGTRLENQGSSPAPLWCPLLLTDSGGPYQWLGGASITVNHGWVATSSCQLVYAATNDNFFILAPTSIQNTGLQDVVGWSGTWSPNYGAEIQCIVPPNQQVWDYSGRADIYFDWSSW